MKRRALFGQRDEDKVDAWVEERLAKKEKIMGIGHRVYKVLDPRAPHLRKMAGKLTEQLGEPKWIRMSERIAEIMRERKGLEANVDFYSATVYYSLDITAYFLEKLVCPCTPLHAPFSSSFFFFCF